MYIFFATSFCIFVCKMWTRATLCTNVSNMISNSIFKDINTYYNILNYKIGMFYRTSFWMFVSKIWPRPILWTNDSSMISYSIFKAINTYSTIVNYEIGTFCPNIFLHEHMRELMQNYAQMMQKWSQIQYLRLLIHNLRFWTIEYVYFFTTSFCM